MKRLENCQQPTVNKVAVSAHSFTFGALHREAVVFVLTNNQMNSFFAYMNSTILQKHYAFKYSNRTCKIADGRRKNAARTCGVNFLETVCFGSFIAIS